MLMQPVLPTAYEQWVPFLPFLGVILGGIIATIGAVSVAHLSNLAQKKHWQRQERLQFLRQRRGKFQDLYRQVNCLYTEHSERKEILKEIMFEIAPEYTALRDYLPIDFVSNHVRDADAWTTMVIKNSMQKTIDDDDMDFLIAEFSEAMFKGLSRALQDLDSEIDKITGA